MKTDIRSRGALRLTPCSYGLSKVQFRGPRRPTDGRFVAFLGGSETFAKYIPQPYPELVEAAIGEVCVNLGCQSAGPDVFLQDSAVQSLCHDAVMTVIQVPGAVNISNGFYRVHPRRNDRFVAPSEKLVALYPEIDFAEIAFTGHLIERLRSVCDARFAHVRAYLQDIWIKRMTQLIEQAGSTVVLLWFASRAPSGDVERAGDAAQDPALVNRAMLEALRPNVADIIEVVGEHGITDGMSFAPLDALSAREMLGEAAHVAAAKALRTPLLHGLF